MSAGSTSVVAWGVETFEHDWLVEVFFGVRAMRSEPGRATSWQEGIDTAARDRGITLQWCMGTPADFAQTTTLTQVTSVRTSGDHGYIASAGQLWAWFCTTNALARSLDLMPFKDVFRADPEVAGQNGEPEALLSALSTGPVGLGDRVGRMDPALALRTCRADGLLVKPHTAIAATDESLLSGPAFTSTLLVAECTSEHPAGRWTYVVAMHANPGDEPISGEIRLESLPRLEGTAEVGPSPARTGVQADLVAWDWRKGTATRLAPDAAIPVSLSREGWAFHVLAPVLGSGLAVIGDVTKFVTAGDARMEVSETSTGARLVVKGAGETDHRHGLGRRRAHLARCGCRTRPVDRRLDRSPSTYPVAAGHRPRRRLTLEPGASNEAIGPGGAGMASARDPLHLAGQTLRSGDEPAERRDARQVCPYGRIRIPRFRCLRRSRAADWRCADTVVRVPQTSHRQGPDRIKGSRMGWVHGAEGRLQTSCRRVPLRGRRTGLCPVHA